MANKTKTTKNTNANKAPLKADNWDALVKRILEPYDQDDVAYRYAISEWGKYVAKERDGEPFGEVIHNFESPEVLEAAVDFFRADIEENLAFFRAKVARNRRMEAFAQVRCALGLYDAVFPGEDDTVDVERLAVIRQGDEAERERNRKLLSVSAIMASEGVSPDEAAAKAELPAAVCESGGIKDFLKDLTEFLEGNGQDGRDLVQQLANDEKFARKIYDDDEMPKPVRFLAGIALKANGVEKHLPKHGPMGFGAAVASNQG